MFFFINTRVIFFFHSKILGPTSIYIMGETCDVTPYDLRMLHPSTSLGSRLDLHILFVQTTVQSLAVNVS